MITDTPHLPAVAFETLTVSTTVVPLTATKVTVTAELTARSGGQDTAYSDRKRADAALLTVETNPVRVRFDGGAPTASVGHLLAAGDALVVTGYTSLVNLQLIRQGAADATVTVTYFRRS